MKILITLIVLGIIGFGAYTFLHNNPAASQGDTMTDTATTTTEAQTPVADKNAPTVIGTSVQGRPITAYHYGTGSKEVLFVGDIHGGYTYNTALLAYKAMDYFNSTPDAIPAGVRVTVIPVLNPDGLYRTVGTTTANFSSADVPTSQEKQIAGRFNGNTVDLNRNFDCDWKPSAQWQGRTVSGGSAAFSEPESQAMKSYVESNTPTAVVIWYASAGGVFASSCDNGVSAETLSLTNLYAKASGYKAYEKYDFNAIPGDMSNWFAKINIPAISILLTTHTDAEWSKNQAGIKALLAHYAE